MAPGADPQTNHAPYEEDLTHLRAVLARTDPPAAEPLPPASRAARYARFARPPAAGQAPMLVAQAPDHPQPTPPAGSRITRRQAGLLLATLAILLVGLG